MNSLAIVAFFAALAAASAGVIAPSAKIIQGPSSRSTLVGPDGSVVSSVSPGAQIITEEHPGVVAHTAPVVAAAPVTTSYAAPAVVAHSAYASPAILGHAAPIVSAYSAPVLSAYSAPVLSAYSAPIVSAYSAPLVSAYAAPAVAGGVVAHSSVDTVVAGPSGTISTSKTVAAPAVYAHGVHGLYF